ncbi:hypothetical protein F2Q70_00035319 [Brassica cretica]|uniref:Uncharacterized protein n=1 Tax=Brassica cretica TaxID=69181 RepID=A0A8S9JWA3_BRACR|nr:hypothetical protein F2Q70_00035319 [Brassica cretica]
MPTRKVTRILRQTDPGRRNHETSIRLDQPGCTSNSPQWRVRVGPNEQSNSPLCELDRTSSPTRPPSSALNATRVVDHGILNQHILLVYVIHGNSLCPARVDGVRSPTLILFDRRVEDLLIFSWDGDVWAPYRHLKRPSKEIAGMIKQKLVETEHSSLSGVVPAFDGMKNIYSLVEFQEDRLEFLANLPISSCNT